jgi:hypothetical protein
MIIKLSPRRDDDTITVSKLGDVLTVNNEEFDFSALGEGETLPAKAIYSVWFLDAVERINGELVLSLWLPIPMNYSQEQAFPADLVNVPDGPVAFPLPLPEVPSETVSEVQA